MSSSQSSALPDETLHRILTQIQLSLTQSTRQLSLVKAQKAAREREKKGVELTRLGIKEETDLGAKSWRGVGKMFILDSPPAIISSLAEQEKSIQVDIDALSKKQKFLEKQIAESQGHMKDFFRGIEMGQQQQQAGQTTAAS
ncbi:hypothetical protein BCV69DRAFT_300173 [Microstroma glucosiphilum]|uniref:Prefoldin n=1 Tax=Pseudomicrostroma glucosiphilum TaxID=1684307 RepID=A0A316U5Y2_9BASI|nr:hypothetical protein BCV69DRAFT_300173 [Pseudomicrostroma glucosiphilum]PWN19871.1 hypothetical protein BCV69DRAFT_300173 [Pseudomicrostroma glucosiphilum]